MTQTPAFQLAPRLRRRYPYADRTARGVPYPKSQSLSTWKTVNHHPYCIHSQPPRPLQLHPGLVSLELSSANELDNVLSNQDLLIGTLLAVLLASFASSLQNRRNQNDFILGSEDSQPFSASTKEEQSTGLQDVLNSTTAITEVEDASQQFQDWKEMSQPENYIWYKKRQQEPSSSRQMPVEQRWVLFALLLLFTPIFSFEFFLTVSRQLLCNSHWEVARQWCAPVLSL